MNDDEEDREFTATERRELRRIMDADRRMTWLKAGVRRWFSWVAGGVLFAFAVSEGLQKFLSWFGKKIGL